MSLVEIFFFIYLGRDTRTHAACACVRARLLGCILDVRKCDGSVHSLMFYAAVSAAVNIGNDRRDRGNVNNIYFCLLYDIPSTIPPNSISQKALSFKHVLLS